MNDFKIMTPGEKIRNIRAQFDFKQEDITGGEITRNLVSIIENNKANLTESVAKVLVANINNLCKEKDIDFSVTEKYLLESVVSQAKKIADEYINYIKSLEVNKICLIKYKLNEIDIFLKTYDTQEKRSILYRAIAKRFKESRMYTKAMDYYLKAYESAVTNRATINALIGLGASCCYLSKYDEALDYYKILLELSDEIQVSYVAKYGIALCNKRSNKVDEALNYLYELTESFKTTEPTVVKEYEVYNLIGICLLSQKSYNKSINLYQDLLKNTKFDKEKIFTLVNLADVYKETKDYANLEKVCSEIKKKIENGADFMEDYEGEIYIALSEDLICIGDIESSKKLFLKAIECFKTSGSLIYLQDIEKAFDKLLSVLIDNSDVENINCLKNEFFELVEKEKFEKASLISFKFIKYYNTVNDSDKISNMLDFFMG